MKIALVNLPSSFLINDRVFPPLGILYIATSIRKLGYEIEFYDLAGKSEEELKEVYINEEFVFITLTTPQVPIARLFIEELLKKDKKKIVVGGCGVVSLDEDFPCDIVVKGDGENLVRSIIDLLNMSKDSKTPLYKIIEDQSGVNIKTTYPARDLIKDYNYLLEGRRTTTMLSSRGCCYKCTYCVDSSRQLQMLPVLNAYKEINQISKLGWKAVMFFDDIFTLKLDRLRQIAYYLRHKDLLYRCFTHVNFVKPELCEILAETNCREVGIGIESGSSKILQTVKKGFEPEKAVEAIKLLKDHGVKVKTFFMVGLPGENEETINETKSFIEESQPDDMDFSVYVPFPGTSLYDSKNTYDISWNSQLTHFKGKTGDYKTTVSTSALSSERIIKIRDDLEVEFKPSNRNVT